MAEALAAVRRHGGRIVLVTGKHTPNAQLHVDHLSLDVDVVEGRVWGTGKGACCSATGPPYTSATTSMTSRVRGRRHPERLGAHRRVHARGARARRHRRRAHRPTDFPAWLDARARPRLAALESACRPGPRARRVQRGSRQRVPARRRRARARRRQRGRRHGVLDSLPLAERGPARDFADSLGVEVLTPKTPEMEREGYRANAGDRCAFCKAELLDVLGPLAGARVRAVATGTNADDARAGFRPGSWRPPSAVPHAARRRPHQGPDPDRLACVGTAPWDKPAAAA